MESVTTRQLVDVVGSDAQLVERWSEAVRAALAGGGCWYHVRVEPVGRAGEVMLQIDGIEGHVALLIRGQETEPNRLANLVRTNLARLAL